LFGACLSIADSLRTSSIDTWPLIPTRDRLHRAHLLAGPRCRSIADSLTASSSGFGSWPHLEQLPVIGTATRPAVGTADRSEIPLQEPRVRPRGT
jgi:hypothetical protein